MNENFCKYNNIFQEKIFLDGNKLRVFFKGFKFCIRKFIEFCFCVYFNNYNYDFIIRLLLFFVNIKLKFMM